MESGRRRKAKCQEPASKLACAGRWSGACGACQFIAGWYPRGSAGFATSLSPRVFLCVATGDNRCPLLHGASIVGFQPAVRGPNWCVRMSPAFADYQPAIQPATSLRYRASVPVPKLPDRSACVGVVQNGILLTCGARGSAARDCPSAARALPLLRDRPSHDPCQTIGMNAPQSGATKVAAGLNPRCRCSATTRVAERRSNAAFTDFRRRSATPYEFRFSANRGLKPTATVVPSLRDGPTSMLGRPSGSRHLGAAPRTLGSCAADYAPAPNPIGGKACSRRRESAEEFVAADVSRRTDPPNPPGSAALRRRLPG